tara:strand:- start:639 stop:1109 length:471 start_codon:yes stop_codon:yes gene_type:complete
MSYKMKGFGGFGDGTRRENRMEKRLNRIAKKANKSQRKSFEESGMDSYVKFMAKGDHSKKTKRLHKRFDRIENKLDELRDKKQSPAKTEKGKTKKGFNFNKKADYSNTEGNFGHKVAKAFIPDLSTPQSTLMEFLPLGKAKKLYKIGKAAYKGSKS